ncbi:MAG: hypothetical protein EXS37_10550 [Opitutus sp.]|nr:hypothetical protein [Opitutus sp.]
MRVICALVVTLAFSNLPAFAASAKKAHTTKNAKEGREGREGKDGKEGKLAGLPGPVVDTIHALQGKGRIGDVSREVEDGETVFEVDIIHGTVTRTHVLDTEGVQLNVEIFPDEMPASVMSAIKTEAGSGKIEFISRSIEEGQVVYDAEIIRGGKKLSATFSAAGDLVGRQVSLAELSPKIQKAVKAQLNGGKLGSVFQGKDSDGAPSYYGASIRSGRTRWFTLDEDGDWVSEEEKITMADAPAPVRQAITQHLGGTHHIRVLRVKEEDGVKFEVLTMKGDSTTSFSVMPGGKIFSAADK